MKLFHALFSSSFLVITLLLVFVLTDIACTARSKGGITNAVPLVTSLVSKPDPANPGYSQQNYVLYLQGSPDNKCTVNRYGKTLNLKNKNVLVAEWKLCHGLGDGESDPSDSGSSE